MIKGIVFDLDGTLISTNMIYAKGLQIVAMRRGKNLKIEEIERNLGRGLGTILTLFFPQANEKEIREIAREWDDESFKLMEGDYKALLYPETMDTLQEVKRKGIRMVIASATDKKNLVFVLDKTGLHDVIPIDVSVSEVGKPKPEPDVIIEALKRIDVKPNEALYVGDMNWDMIAGRAAGCRTVLINRNDGTESYGADILITNLKELLNLI